MTEYRFEYKGFAYVVRESLGILVLLHQNYDPGARGRAGDIDVLLGEVWRQAEEIRAFKEAFPNPEGLKAVAEDFGRRIKEALERLDPSDPVYRILTLEEGRAAGVCEWGEDSDGIWNTACGECFVTTDGKPSENEMRFCCYCGASLVEVPFTVDIETEES